MVGTGFSGSAHVDALSRLRDIDVIGVLASSPDRSAEAAERLRVPRAYATLDEVVSDSEVDAVHNCTPNVLHADVTVAVLRAGKHVLSEKPLAMDAEQARELASHADRADVVTGVCFNYRHFPLVQQMRATIGNAEFGPVHLIRGAYLQDWLLFRDDWNWRLESARAGATRAVGDIGSHWLDLAQHVTGLRVVAVMADLGRLYDERMRPAAQAETFRRGDGRVEAVAVDTEDFGSVLLRLEGGGHGIVTVSQVTAGAKNRLTIGVDLSTASIEWNQEEPNSLRIGRRDAANLDLPRDPTLLAPNAAGLARLPAGHQDGCAAALRNLFADFYAAVAARGEGRPYEASFATFDESHRVVRLVEAIADSHRDGRWVTVDDDGDDAVAGAVGQRKEAST